MRSLILREAAISEALEMAASFRKPLDDGLVDHGLSCKAAALIEFVDRLRVLPEAPEVIDFPTALELAKARFRAHPLWDKLVETPWFAVYATEALDAVLAAIRDAEGKSDEGFAQPPLAGGWPGRHAERS